MLSHCVRSAEFLVQLKSGAAAVSRKLSASLTSPVMYEWPFAVRRPKPPIHRVRALIIRVGL
jgi:hypothetical protein